MDIFDRAQEAAERMNAQALAAHRKNTAAVTGPARTHCLECEQPIPAKRREKVPGCERCVRCQEIFEDMERWRG